MSFRSVKDPLEFIFEVQRKKETRKMSYASLPGFDMLHDNIESLYELRGESFSLKYVDPEGDKITLSSNNELEEAVSLAPRDGEAAVVRIVVVPQEGSSSPQPPSSTSDEHGSHGLVLHEFIKSVVNAENIERLRNWLSPENVIRARDQMQQRLQRIQQRADRGEAYTIDEFLREAGIPVTNNNSNNNNNNNNNNNSNQADEENAALRSLAEMGFYDEQRNRTLYRQNGRDLQRTLEALMQ